MSTLLHCCVNYSFNFIARVCVRLFRKSKYVNFFLYHREKTAIHNYGTQIPFDTTLHNNDLER